MPVDTDHRGGDALADAIAHAAHSLPNQGPIGVFVHHNPLHALQDLEFHHAVEIAAARLDARPYLPEDELRDAWKRGRIADADVDAVLPGSDAPVALGLTERTLRRALLAEDLEETDGPGLAWRASTTDLGASALWLACVDRLAGRPGRPIPRPEPRRHRDVLVALGIEDPDIALHAELQRLSASFLDQGQALLPMPGREGGFLAAVAGLHASGAGEPRFARGVRDDLRRLAAHPHDGLEVVRELLTALGVDDTAAFVEATLLALPGWAGMFSRLEHHPEEEHGHAVVRLVDYLAVRLLHDRRALEILCREAGLPVAWRQLRTHMPAPALRDPICEIHLLHGLAHGAGPAAVAALTDAEIDALFAAVDAFPELVRRRTLHDAWERFYRRQILDGFAARRARVLPRPEGRAKAQFVFCIDEREESIRRALEEQDPLFETFGVAGFFGVAIDYQGLEDGVPAAHAPVVVVPAHEVHEVAVDSERALNVLRDRLRERWKRVMRGMASSTRSIFGGAAQSLLLGPVRGAEIAGHVVAPRAAVALRARLGDRLLPRPTTRLRSFREEVERSDRGKYLGFTLPETVDRVTSVLTNLGLVRDFAPIVVILGHGSTSLNNPHESAHDCGACGGRRGGANARLFAEMANHPDVRAGVAGRGIHIPDDTWFVGSLHDTSDDSVTTYDLERVPAALQPALDVAWRALEVARRDNARERARRFHDAPLGISPDAALHHVESRAAHLAQPRPEYGHCTNAVCHVGRRSLTRGLFLDRRSFLVSYDPTSDDGNKVLERILAAVGPVGAGINLEYWFSAVDTERYGCGTKLPHNVTGLLGVMNGHGSDLRTGLPLQMTELHEPMRLLLVVDATPEALLDVAGRQAEVAQLVTRGWVQLVSAHPVTGAMLLFEHGGFVAYHPDPGPLPVVRRSVEWFGGTREHLPPALVEPA